MKKMMMTLFVSIVFALSACSAGSDAGSGLQSVDAVWLPNGQVYVIRNPEPGLEVWRHDGNQDTFVARGADISSACSTVDFLFDAGGGRLGIALECFDGTERLVSYTSEDSTYRTLFDVPSAAEIAIRPDGSGGYLSTGHGDCWELSTFGGVQEDALAAMTPFTCDRGGSAKGPHLLPSGELLFLATVARPAERPVSGNERTWRLYLLTPGRATARPIGPMFAGLPQVGLAPSGKTAVVAVATQDGASLLAVDLDSGDSHRLAHRNGSIGSPAVSPQGDRVLYVNDSGGIETVSMSK